MQREFQFYIVPTPIGNMGDITFRAVEVLKSVDVIACEDTRTTQYILNHYNIKTKTVSYHKFNEKSKADEILSLINSGKTVALVSDAGTPMICDPGSVLLRELRRHNISVTSLAGACAVSTFLSQVPRDSEVFTFAGFFPRTRQKAEELLLGYSSSNLVFYEAPNRILSTLKLVEEVRGDVTVALSRELTKLYEETIIDAPSKIIEHFKDGIKGEIVCMVYASESGDIKDMIPKIDKLKRKGFKSKEIATILSELYDVNKNDVYKLTT
ncbi:MAG: 16S rRNA (cytidine(1402)-2'-O)-methyltransferase [Cyanobacteria bacterium RUI128]|nr:16S rRNA (cytidine(1402)-2'-O)-methyltransferase [Cyanobacteria bacterium RUI128]